MKFEDLLVHTATFQSRSDRRDRFGQPVDAWEDKVTAKCRLGLARGGERYTDRSQGVVVADYMLFLLPDVDVCEADRVSQVVASDGSVLAENLDILLVGRCAGVEGECHHLELPCRVHREPSGG